MKHIYVDRKDFEKAFEYLFDCSHLLFINKDNHISFYYYSIYIRELVEIHCTCKNLVYSDTFIKKNKLVEFDNDDDIIAYEKIDYCISRNSY